MSFWFNLYFSFLKISLFKKNLLLEQIGREIKKKKKKKRQKNKVDVFNREINTIFCKISFL